MYYHRPYNPYWSFYAPMPWHHGQHGQYGLPIGPMYQAQIIGSNQLSSINQSFVNSGVMSGSAGSQYAVNNNFRY